MKGDMFLFLTADELRQIADIMDNEHLPDNGLEHHPATPIRPYVAMVGTRKCLITMLLNPKGEEE